MGKRVVITTTRPDSSIPWYTDVALTIPESDALTAEQTFLIENYDNIGFSHSSTDTTYTVTLDFSNTELFDQYVSLITSSLEGPYKAYVEANGMTVTREISDI